MKKTTETENLKEQLHSAAEKATEMAKTFAENSAKQFEAAMHAGKTMFETITKHHTKDNSTEFIKDGIESSVSSATKWFKESSKVMTDLYDKQVNFMLNSYSHFMEAANENMGKVKETDFAKGTFHTSLDSFLKTIEDSSAVMKKMFSTIIDKLTDEADKGYVKEVSDLMQETYSKQTEQLLKFNKGLLDKSNLESTIKLNKEISDKLQKDLEKNFEASKKIIKSISDSYTKDSNFSPKSGKKMLDEIFAEIDVVTKNNMKFWTNWFDEVYANNKKTAATNGKAAKNGVNAN
ncbi:MAG TPA: hypothetical protein VK890_08530 [Bacteroidia bacterium]|nr:hypothetical protein [Bacteroidia bacterium]